MYAGDRIVAACEKHWEAHKADCSGFVKAVATELGVELTGMANDIVDQIQGPSWMSLANGVDAARQSGLSLVVAGLKAEGHGHVVIVVPGPLAHDRYPSADWGDIFSVGEKNATINWAWNQEDRDKVIYAWHALLI